MSKTFAVMVMVCAGVLAAETDEEAAARRPVEAYLMAHATGKGEYLDRAFHPEARIQGMRLDGAFANWTLAEYRKGFSGSPAADEPQRKRRIDVVDLRGSAGMAKVTLDYPKAVFTDYFVLLKLNGEWKIMNKVFHVEAK